MALFDKLKQLRNNSEKTQADFAKTLGIGLSTYQNYERGERDIPSNVIETIITTFKIKPEWLFSDAAEQITTIETTKQEMYLEIPVVSGRIAAGQGFSPDCTIETYLSFRADWVRQKGSPETMSLIRVSGDSMEPTLSHGDVVLIDHSRNYIDSFGVYAISIDDHIMIKRLMLIGDKIHIVSDNSKYPPLVLQADEVTINGKAIWYAHEIKN